MTTPPINPLPDNHAARRGIGYQPYSTKMIGRLTVGEFDRLDAIVANTRIGIAPTLVALGRTLCAVDPDSLRRRLYEDGKLGLVEMEQVDEVKTSAGSPMAVYAFTLSERGWFLFKEALAMMDRGEVAA